MKIAIMTLRPSKNYGGILQAWALQQVLKNEGNNPVTIYRETDPKSFIYYIARNLYRFILKIFGKRKGPINFEKNISFILKNTKSFIGHNINMSEVLGSSEDLEAHFQRENYDAVIVGSDQTWRPSYSPNIGNFFLDFLKGSDIKRIAYASSFGVDNWEYTEKQTQHFAQLIKEFDAISVREASGVNLCKEYLGVEAIHVLDPTLLVKREAYEALFEVKNIPSREGIYTYILDQSEWKNRVVETARRILEKPVYCNQPRSSMHQPTSKELADYVMPSVEGWVKGFHDAEFVITDSFHGAVFAIIFNKPFISLMNPKRGASRFYSMLNQFGLEKRLVSSFDINVIENIIAEPVGYADVNMKLSSLRKKSESFLFYSLDKVDA